MSAVKIKEKYQVTIPSKLRKQLRLKVGDLLDAQVEDDRIVLKPQVVIEKTKAWERFRMALNEAAEHNQEISDEEVVKDVLDAIREVRKAKRA
jgi:AbrB family looped-hinge helix DNA binding protein